MAQVKAALFRTVGRILFRERESLRHDFRSGRKEHKLKARMYSCHECGRIMTVDYPPTHNKLRDYVDKPLVRPGPAGFRQGKG